MKIVLDCFGGDNAPKEAVIGGINALTENKELSLVLSGDEKKIRSIIEESFGKIPERVEFLDAPEVIENEDDPISAVRKKKNSSLIAGLYKIAQGEGDAFVSAGNTGAVFTGATLIIKRIKGIKRGALAPLIPTLKGKGVIIDVGANAECKSEYYPQFAIMGSVYAKEVLEIQNPKVGLINIGVEHHKGTTVVKEAYKLLENEKNIDFLGNIEARDVLKGDANVLVSDGWTGNIAVKTVEGTASAFMHILKEAFYTNIFTKLAALVLKPHIKNALKQFDSKETGGALIAGLRAPVIKAHGNSDRTAFKNAVLFAHKCAERNICKRIEELLPKEEENTTEE